MDLWLLLLCISSVICSLLAIQEERPITSILLLLGFTISIGAILIYISAIYAGIFHLMVYSGVITTLFAMTSFYAEADTKLEEAVQ